MTQALTGGVVTTIAANTPVAIPPGPYRILADGALTYSTTVGGVYSALTGEDAEPGALVTSGFIQAAAQRVVVIKRVNSLDSFSSKASNPTPIAYWRQNEQFGSVLFDSVGIYNMTKPAGVTLNQPGIVTGALSALYNGASSSSVVADPISGASAITVEAIINNPAFAAGHEMVWSNAGSATYASFDTGKPIMSLRLVGVQFINRAVSALSAATWYHVAYTWKSGEPIRLYVNGAEVASEDLTVRTGTIDPGGTMYLGSFGGGSLFWSGYLADVILFNRRLTASEIASHAQARLNAH